MRKGEMEITKREGDGEEEDKNGEEEEMSSDRREQ